MVYSIYAMTTKHLKMVKQKWCFLIRKMSGFLIHNTSNLVMNSLVHIIPLIKLSAADSSVDIIAITMSNSAFTWCTMSLKLSLLY